MAETLKAQKVKFKYEPIKLKYVVPSRVASYTPDFVLEDGRVLEIKGRLTAADRKKLVAVREANPSIEIYIGFQRPNNPIYKGSNTSCADWADEQNIPWFDVKELEQWL